MASSPHENCTAHSGLHVRVNINILLSTVAVLVLSVMLNLLIEQRGETSAAISMLTIKMDTAEKRLDAHDRRLERLERRE